MSCAAVDRGWSDLALELYNRADRSAEEILARGAKMPEWLFAVYVIQNVLALAFVTALILGMEVLTNRIYIVFFATFIVSEAGLLRTQEPLPCEEGYEPGYLLSWNRVPGDDDGRLRRFLGEEMNIGWADRAFVEKSDDNTVMAFSSDNWARIVLGRKDGRAQVVTSDRRTRYLDAREEDGAFDLYCPDNRMKHRFLVHALSMWGAIWLALFFVFVLDVNPISSFAGRLGLLVVWLNLYSIIDERTASMLLGEEAEWTDEDLAEAGLCWERRLEAPPTELAVAGRRKPQRRACEAMDEGDHK